MKFESALDGLLAEADEILSPRIRSLVIELRDEWRMLDKKIEALNAEFVALARQNSAMRRLTSIPGIGVLNATALVAAIGDAASFKHARDLGAWLGLVPRQFTTGGKARLLGITKRGNTYLRTLLVHGARAAMHTLSQSYANRAMAPDNVVPRRPAQCRNCCPGKQARAYRLGGVAQGAAL